MSDWYVYTFIACAVWAVLTGAMLVSCFLEDEE